MINYRSQVIAEICSVSIEKKQVHDQLCTSITYSAIFTNQITDFNAYYTILFRFICSFSYFPAHSLFSVFDKCSVNAFLLHKLFVPALLDYPAVINNYDLICVFDGF